MDETPSNRLEAALTPLLDIDAALKYFAWDNALANGDGFWTRASDYDLYQDPNGRFHIIPYDANETFSSGGGPGGPGGPGGFGPGMLLAEQMLVQGDKNADQKLTKEEFSALADTWFDKLDLDKTGKLSQEQFAAKLPDLLPPPPGRGGFGPPDGGGQGGGQRPGGRRGGFRPGMFLAPPLFTAMDANQDGAVTREELKDTFAKWFTKWATNTSGELTQMELRDGLNAALPRPNFGGPRGGPGGGGPGGGGPGGGGPGRGGTELDPLANASDTSKPLLSKLLAVPSLRARYLGYVRDIAENGSIGPAWARLPPNTTHSSPTR